MTFTTCYRKVLNRKEVVTIADVPLVSSTERRTPLWQTSNYPSSNHHVDKTRMCQ